MSIEKNCAKWKYFNSNLCWMQKDVLIEGLSSRILVFRVWPWYSTWKIQVQQSCMQKNWLQVEKYVESYNVFFKQLTRLVAESQGTWVLFLKSAENISSTSAILCGTEPVSTLTHSLFILLCFLWFFFWGFRLWLSCADRVVNLNTTIWLPLFWRTWTRVLLAWHMGKDCSHCRA